MSRRRIHNAPVRTCVVLDQSDLDQLARFVEVASHRARETHVPTPNKSQALRHAWRLYVESLAPKLRAYVEGTK